MKVNLSRAGVVIVVTLAVLLIGITAYSATSQVLAVGAMAHSEIVGGPATVTMRLLTIDPGEVLGWHYHPGAGAYTIVRNGTLVVEDGCGGDTVYPEGQAFLEPPFRVHRGKNLTGEAVVTAQTFIVPAGSGISVSTAQLCGPPAVVEECRSGGWTTFTHPRLFVNQGDCQQFVITGK
jgi:quercetin dioxygenase-like cupin family protein